MKREWLLGAAAAVLVTSTAVAAGSMQGQGSISPFIGGYTFDGTQHLRTRPVYGVRAGYGVTDAVGVEALLDYTRTKPTQAGGSVDAYRFGGDLLYHFVSRSNLVPFLAAGAGGTTVDAAGSATRFAFDYGGGVKYFLNERFLLRGDVRHIIVVNDTNHNLEYTLGLAYLFGGKQAPAPPPAAKGEPVDSDGDGIADDRDACPGSPKGAVVDSRGCPPDSDRDGVPDFRDQCPGTPPGVQVNADGCTLDDDADRDGVPDSRDRCPGTPGGVQVDQNGCPLDADGDGVPDQLDRCPGTPRGVKVDEKGCPLDADRDGVPDHLDRCPGTPAGVKVDDTGCPPDSDADGVPDHLDACPGTPPGIPVKEDGCSREKLSISLYCLFDTGKSDIKPEFEAEIAKAGDFLRKYPGTKAVIEGHTDNVGNVKMNEKLSLQRAEQVRKHLVQKYGIDPSRLSAKGYGPSKPVADNGTELGRKKNRRIEAVIETIVTR